MNLSHTQPKLLILTVIFQTSIVEYVENISSWSMYYVLNGGADRNDSKFTERPHKAPMYYRMHIELTQEYTEG